MTSLTDENTKNILEVTIKIAMIALLFSWCFFIVQPFIVPIVWAMIISVSIYPIYTRLVVLLKGRHKLSATLITFILLLIIAIPCILFCAIIISNAEELGHKLIEGSFTIPLPSEKVASWPVIGSYIFKYWTFASTNIIEVIKEIAPQLKLVAKWLFTSSFSITLALFQFVLAIIISGVLLANGQGIHHFALLLARRFVGKKGETLCVLTKITIRSVTTGVLGVALIQSLCAGAGLVVASIPGAGLLTLICFLLAVIQIGPALVLILSIVYTFAIHDNLFAIIYTVWCVFVMLMDNVLKPVLLGRGNNIPTVIIFLGAIGGLMFSGIIGLFVGAVILALGYEIFRAWLFEYE